MTGLLREVGRARRAVEQFAEAAERIAAFSVRLDELPLLHAGDSFALLTGDPSVDETIARQVAQVDTRATENVPLPNGRGSDRRIVAPISAPIPIPVSAATVSERSNTPIPPPIGAATVRERSAARPGSAASGWNPEPFSNSTAVLAQRFENAGLKTAWESAFHTAVEPPPPAAAFTQTASPLTQQLLRIVERAERAGRARTPAPGRPGLANREIPMAAGDREFVPRRPLTHAEAEKLRAATTVAPASDASPRQWPMPAGVEHDREWGAPMGSATSDHDAVPHERWVSPTGSGLRRLASLAGVLPGDPAREGHEGPLRQSAPFGGDADFVTRLEEALRAEAVRSGIDPEGLIR